MHCERYICEDSAHISEHFMELSTCSFICQGTSTRRQRSDLFGLRVKLPPVTTNLTTQRSELKQGSCEYQLFKSLVC